MAATYLRHGRGRSRNAEFAEQFGRCPLSRAIPVVAAEAGVSRKLARAALEHTHDGEWHHVGKYACECPYYDPAEAIAALEDAAIRAALERELMVAEMQDKILDAIGARELRAAGASVKWHRELVKTTAGEWDYQIAGIAIDASYPRFSGTTRDVLEASRRAVALGFTAYVSLNQLRISYRRDATGWQAVI